MPLTENQKQKEKTFPFRVERMRLIKDTENGKKGEIINFHHYGSMVSWDENGRWFSFYDLELIK